MADLPNRSPWDKAVAALQLALPGLIPVIDNIYT